MLELSQVTVAALSCEERIEIVSEGHLLEERGALDVAARLATSRFVQYVVDVQR